MQLEAPAAADRREVIPRDGEHPRRPAKLRIALDMLKPGDTLVIYKPNGSPD
jgi:hypothetical protein